ncbi:putative polyketide synthase [Xylaria telfairii]|nr:putative polyketide synthase [Xylaria telfairii]
MGDAQLLKQTGISGFEPIAIIGMAMRLPGRVRSEKDLWRLLSEKRSGLCEVPKDRFNVDGFHSSSGQHGTIPTSKGYFIEDLHVQEFDPSVFKMTKKELERLDPSQRQLLQAAYECLENAGVPAWQGSKLGCYIGCFGEDWQDLNAKETQHRGGGYRATGYADFTLANRISYELDLRGPSMTVKTACSSSLVCLDLACAAIQRGECDGALVGGVSLIFSPTMWIALNEQGLLSPTGQCRTFDASADGYARGEAINMILVKKVEDAVHDGDPIHAIIRGTGVNMDGQTPTMLIPSPSSQAALIKRTYEAAGISNLSETAIFETHGTGTAAGDPLEAEAVAECFGDKGVIITSIKPNIGHSEGAAGLSSLIKCVVALKHRLVLPNINFETPNPNIPFERFKLHVPTEVESWPEGRAERISINSFGIGGTNAHVILESPSQFGISGPPPINLINLVPGKNSPSNLLLFSAYSPLSLKNQILSTQEYTKTSGVSMHDLAYSLSNRREKRPHRAYAVASDASSWQVSPTQEAPQSPTRIFWVFTGQGAQWPRMGADLLDTNDTFRNSIRKLDRFLATVATPPPRRIEDELRKDSDTSRVHEAEMGHTLSLALQIGLIDVFKSWNISPSTVIGHSSGEMAAAYACGAISAENAIAAALFRSSLTGSLNRSGSMAAIGLGREKVFPYLEPGVTIACENSQSSVTISGDTKAVEKVVQTICSTRPDVFTRRIQVQKAYHSHHMWEYGPAYEKHLRPYLPDLTLEPQIPFYSSVTGDKLVGAGTLGAAYWRRNMESPVLFNSALRSALRNESDNNTVLIEIGPHPALGGPIRQILSDVGRTDSHIGTLSRGRSCHESMLHLAGKLFQNGVPMNHSFICPPGCYVKDLPPYAWNRDTTYWAESRLAHEWRFRQYPPHELLGSRVVESGNEPSWRNIISLENIEWLSGHQISGKIVFPASGYIAMIGEALRQLHGKAAYTVQNVRITSALLLEVDAPTEVITSLHHTQGEKSKEAPWYTFTISSHNGGGWISNCTGETRSSTGDVFAIPIPFTMQGPFPRKVSANNWYRNLRRVKMDYTGLFKGLGSITSATTTNNATAEVVVPKMDKLSVGNPYAVHPSTMDKCFQVFTVACYRGLGRNMDRSAVPTFIEEMTISPSNSNLEVTANVPTTKSGSFKGDLLAQSFGKPCLYLKGFEASVLADDSKMANHPIISHFQWHISSDFADFRSYMYSQQDCPREWPLLEELVLLCVFDHQQNISLSSTTPPHLTSFTKWMRAYTGKYLSGTNKFLSHRPHLGQLDDESRNARIQDIIADLLESPWSMFSTAIYRLFQAASSIFAGETHPVGVLLEDNLLSQIYIAGDTIKFGTALNIIGTTNPLLRVLEVGAGTGGTTVKCLAALTSPFGERLYSSYTYTDISSGFMNAAKERFGQHDRIEYAVLDITKDPLQQGYHASSYDLIICSNVLHATPCLRTSLRHVHQLLSQGGRIFLEELCPEANFIDYIYGFLPGWWLDTKDGRAEQPYVAPERWTEELVSAGFQTPEAVVFDRQPPYQLSAGILASRDSSNENPSSVTLLSYTPEAPLIQEIRTYLETRQVAVDVCIFGQALRPHQPVISLLDLQEPTLHSFSKDSFDTMMNYLKSHKTCIIWAMPISQIDCEDPRAAMMLGLSRTARNELSLHLLTVETDSVTPHQIVVEALFKILTKAIRLDYNVSAPVGPDYEYAIKDGEVLIPRLHWQTVDEATAALYQKQEKPDTDLMRLEVKTPGLLKSIYWVRDKMTDLADNAVFIENKAVGLNFRDVLIAMNMLDNSTSEIGLEGSGIVRAVGAGVHGLAIGDRVMYMSDGCFATHLTVPAALCVKMDESLTFKQAAAIPCVYATALMALVDKANLQRGQSVLIQSACGGVGLAAIQIAQMIGADIYCTAGSSAKTQYLSEHYGINRSRIFNSRDSSFLPAIMEATNGQGVDVVLNSLSGELLHASWKCVARFGTMIEIGKRDFRRRAKLSMEDFEQNRTFIGLDLWEISKLQPDKAARLIERCVKLIQAGLIRGPVIAGVYQALEIQAAIRTMQAAQHIGKLIITLPDNPQTLEAKVCSRAPVFRQDCCYLLVGGLGGLGRAVATWMAENGAGELIFVSRTARGQKAQEFIDELRSQGCHAHLVAGDVSNPVDVQRAMRSGTRPLVGIINMAMVLKDIALSEMTLSDWDAAVKPKVTGTWNLHHTAPADLDFFILFSSYSGIVGHWGQANYAAANTFLDSFVRYRRRSGLAASVIDIGVMGDVGFVSSDTRVLQQFERSGMQILREKDLLDAIGLAIQDSRPKRIEQERAKEDQQGGQLVLGVLAATAISSASTRLAWKRDARMAIYHNLNEATETIMSGQTTTKKSLKELLSMSGHVAEGGRGELVAKAIAEALESFLIKETGSIQVDAPLSSLRMDSLVAIELRNWIRQQTAVDVSVFTITQAPSLLSLGEYVCQEVERAVGVAVA